MFEHIREDLRRFHDIEYLREDLQRPQVSRAKGSIEIIRMLWDNPALKALITYRIGRWLQRARRFPVWWLVVVMVAPAYWLLTAYFRCAYDIYLEQSADIGSGLYIGHFGGIHLRNCRLGAHCAIQQEVWIGPAPQSTEGPKIGDRVWIGAHARIEGKVSVGDRVTIAAAAKITRDVGDGCLMLGNPARVGQMNYDNSAFL
jgi:serine O-acetyltransferase